jgi:hypothetical protein
MGVYICEIVVLACEGAICIKIMKEIYKNEFFKYNSKNCTLIHTSNYPQANAWQ